MDARNKVRSLLGLKPVSIGELDRRAAAGGEVKEPPRPPVDRLAGIEVTAEYGQVRDLVEAGAPIVLVTGSAGTGKSTLIQYLRSVITKRLAVLAPTGVAALNAGGVTIHSFFHFAPKILEEEDIKLVYDRQLYLKLEVLIIDEVSMVRCDLMDAIDRFLRKNRESTQPFGGVQLVLIGDLFQLPPVVPRQESEVLRAKGYRSPFFFSALSLQKASLVPVELSWVYRQHDPAFVELLNQVRVGEHIDRVVAVVNERCAGRTALGGAITLTCTNIEADAINRRESERLSGEEHVFTGRIEGQFSIEEDRLPSPMELRLRAGARVMFTKNDEQKRWVNGTLGTVRDVGEALLRVECDGDAGTVHDVLPVTWETYKYTYDAERDKIVAVKVGQYTQYPLMLAWAVTIHKSQGKTLESVRIDLGSGAFASGQVYVALSRCRSLDGIQLARPLRNGDVKCDQRIVRFYEALRSGG